MSDAIYKRLDYDQALFLTNQIFAKLKASPLNAQYTIALNNAKTAYELKASINGGTATVIASISVAASDSAGLMSANDKSKLDGIVVPTAVSQLTNDSGYQTAAQVDSAIDAKISAVYKPGGSVAFANLPALTASYLGYVYNVTDSFTTTNDFVEGAGKAYSSGTNVVIINSGTSESPVYKYDVLSGLVDLSGYVQASQMATLTNQEITTAVNTAYTAIFGA